ncbi:CBS domain-containing protein CBSCBSPB3-like [Impatiens glandulifera]|uniref:CBS domain-containing protein CBSCBSPB3-like n=1 Tax=Impatiens glandulifera TaxID=253017 RepID=UPI001FB13C60|nr:CBS domain-containing protein CBSCBSPB3-like [Impatiens glandulifera]
MSGQVAPAPKKSTSTSSLNQKRNPSTLRKTSSQTDYGMINGAKSKPSSPNQSSGLGERTVKKLRLSKAFTIPDGTTVSDACRRMAARRADAVLLTDSNGLLSGIVTDKDIVTRVIAEELRADQTVISKIMTKNPTFVTSDSLAIEALQKMVQGKFRHLPVVENGEVVALLDITKCLYDAIFKMEKAAEQGSAIAAAVEGVERQFGSDFSAPSAFIETLKERMFKPSLSTIIGENANVAVVSPSDAVNVAAKMMQESRVSAVVIAPENKILGILTSKDILMRVVSQNLSPELTAVEKVMTPNPVFVTLESTILEALHIMHDGKFLHLPVVDKNGNFAACVDVLQITHAVISMIENSSGGAVNDIANTIMQKFWDSAISQELPDDYENKSEMSMPEGMTPDGAEHGKNYPSLGIGNSFTFKFEDCNGRIHRFNFGTENLGELLAAIVVRLGISDNQSRPHILYQDDEGDKVLLTNDADLVSAVGHAKSAGLKVLRLHFDYPEVKSEETSESKDTIETENRCITETEKRGIRSLQYSILAGTVAVVGIGVLVYLKRANLGPFLQRTWQRNQINNST